MVCHCNIIAQSHYHDRIIFRRINIFSFCILYRQVKISLLHGMLKEFLLVSTWDKIPCYFDLVAITQSFLSADWFLCHVHQSNELSYPNLSDTTHAWCRFVCMQRSQNRQYWLEVRDWDSSQENITYESFDRKNTKKNIHLILDLI